MRDISGARRREPCRQEDADEAETQAGRRGEPPNAVASIAIETLSGDIAPLDDLECFLALYEHTDLGIFQVTPDGKVLRVNRACARLFGYDDPEHVRREVRDVGAQAYADPQQRQQVLAEAFAQDGMHSAEIRYRRRDGSEFLGAVKTQPMRDASGEVRYLFGFIEDITDKRAAERALLLSESRYRSLFETSTDAILIETPAGHVLEANEAACRLFGVERGAWGGVAAEDLVAPDERERVRNLVASNPPAKSRLVEMQALRADGSTFTAEVRSWRTELDGAPLLYVYIRDVSDREQLEARLRQSQKMEALGRLAGGVAHDFNNILTAIMGHAELLEIHLADALERSDAGRAAVEQILEAGQRAAALTRQLLTFSRGPQAPPPPLDPVQALDDMRRLLQGMLPTDTILHVSAAPQPWRTRVDAAHFEQVVMNLVVNARDALAEAGGQITIHTTNETLGEEDLRQSLELTPGRYVVIAVSDNGCGMDEATRQHAFEPFFTTKGRGRGTGLGLALVHGIARHSGGGVMIESSPKIGTCIRVFFPAVGDD